VDGEVLIADVAALMVLRRLLGNQGLALLMWLSRVMERQYSDGLRRRVVSSL